MNKKVLFIDNDSNHTGSTISLGYLIKGFSDNNYDVFVLTRKTENHFDYFRQRGAKPVFYGFHKVNDINLDLHFTCKDSVFTFIGFIKFVKNILKFFMGMYITYIKINEIKPDLVYLNEYVVIQTAIISRIMKIPTVTHIRSRFLSKIFRIRRYLLARSILKYNDFVFAISNQEAEQIKAYDKNKSEKIIVIGEFLDKNNFQTYSNIDAIKRKYNVPVNYNVILMLGGILPIKGSLDFIKAAEIIAEKYNNYYFIIAGKIPVEGDLQLMDYVKSCISSAEILTSKNMLNIMGEISNIIELIACCDILVSPSTETHFSRPIIEAWAQKKAVIATDIAHSKELIEDNKNGLLATVGNYQEIADAIIKLGGDKKLSDILASEGLKKSFKYYNFDVNIGMILEKCNNLIKGPDLK